MRFHRAVAWCLVSSVLGFSLAACSGGGGDNPPPGNLPPVAHGQQVQIAEDTTVSATLSAEDPEGAPLVFSIVEPPLHGALTLTDAATGSFTYTPSANYFGDDGFSFKVTDGQAESAPALVAVSVSPVNDPPSATSASIGSAPIGPMTRSR